MPTRNKLFAFLRWLLISISLIVILLGAVFIYIISQKDQIIRLFVNQANQYLLVKVEVEKIDLTLFSSFPKASISLQGLKMQGSDGLTDPLLLDASQLSFQLDLIDLLQKRYLIQYIELKDAEISLITDGKGKLNYRFISADSSQQTNDFAFSLKGIYLNNTILHYRSPETKFSMAFDRSKAQISGKEDYTFGNLDGLVTIYSLQTGAMTLLQNTDLELVADFKFKESTKSLNISKTRLRYRNSDFLIDGAFQFEQEPNWEVRIKSEQLALEDLKNLLPGQISQVLREYKAGGQASVELSMTKRKGQKSGITSAKFNIRKGTMSHPSSPGNLSDIHLSGNLKNIGRGAMEDYVLTIDTMHFQLDKNRVGGTLRLNNFNEPYLNTRLRGRMPAVELQAFIKSEQLKINDGMLDVSVALEQSFGTKESRKISGEVKCTDLNLMIPPLTASVRVTNADLLFNENDLIVSQFALNHRGQHLTGNAIVFNAFATDSTLPYRIGANIRSPHLVLDSLITSSEGSTMISLPKRIIAQAKIESELLHYKRHRYRKMESAFYLDSTVFSIQGLSLQMAGGQLKADASLELEEKGTFRINLNGTCEKVPIDTLFYYFQDFEQQFITHQHLKGVLTANGRVNARIKQNGELMKESIVADIELLAENGRLYRFEPMKQLSRFADEEELSDIKFKTLSNKFHIENQTLFIPEMVIGSSLRDLTVSGTHGFDQKINYRLKVPIAKPKATDKDERFGAIEQDASGKLYLYLTITGTTDNMKIQYDKKAVTGKISERFKAEKEELKQLFKFKSDSLKIKPKKIELEENNYFDFD
jgi:uncharacterized protein involved in outer membrane biogenesis